MKIALISIGSELLSGKTVNTNASYLGEILLKAGYKLDRIVTIGDTEEELIEALTDIEGDLVFTTGGLGPTGDDLTKKCLSSITRAPLVRNPEIEADLHKRYPDLDTNDEQATYPKGAILFPNGVGTALGFFIGRYIALPGVPSQMKHIMEEHVLPFMGENYPPEHVAKTLYLTGPKEGDVDPFLRQIDTDIEIGICPSYGYLSVYLVGKDKTELDRVATIIEHEFADVIYSSVSNDIAYALHEILKKKKYTIACAESCTGGRAASRLTAYPGSSSYFLGSLVTYANNAKEVVLGVDTIQAHGAVSEETARAMAKGVADTLKPDISVAITGIAGPDGGTEEKPAGTVYIAVNDEVIKLQARGTRESIMEVAVNAALRLVWRKVR